MRVPETKVTAAQAGVARPLAPAALLNRAVAGCRQTCWPKSAGRHAT
jgi:hypothetical protein